MGFESLLKKVKKFCPLLSVSKTHKKHKARPGFFRHSTLFYYVIVIAEMIDDEKRTFFIHGSYTFAISQSYIKQCTNFQSQLLFDAFTYDLGVSSQDVEPSENGLLGHLIECCCMLNTVVSILVFEETICIAMKITQAYMRYHLFLHYSCFLYNLEKGFFRTNVHTKV